MATIQGPSYYFTVEDLSATPNVVQRQDARGYWLPPRRQGSNSKIPATCVFYHDGTRTSTVAPGNLLNGLHVHKTCSIYHARDVLWTIDYDASVLQVGDGSHRLGEETQDSSTDSDEDDDDEQRPYEDWRELSFREENQAGHMMSIAGRRLPESRLVRRRDDQIWHQYFIPDRYQSRTTTLNQNEGGLVGDLALLIGLMAMTMDPIERTIYIPLTMAARGTAVGVWQVSSAQVQAIQRGTRWLDRKGLVVKVYLDPSGTTSADLAQYESGAQGPILA